MALQEEETDVQVSIMDDESEHNPSNVELGGILPFIQNKRKERL